MIYCKLQPQELRAGLCGKVYRVKQCKNHANWHVRCHKVIKNV